MKQLFLALTIFICQLLSAQTTFEISGPTAPTRDAIFTSGYGHGKYVLIQSSIDPTKRKTGKIFLYSSDNKLLAQRDYKLDVKFNTIASVHAIVLKDKVVVFLAASADGGSGGCKPVIFNFSLCMDITMQEYDINTLAPIGSPSVIKVPKENYYSTSFFCSEDGKYFATLGMAYKVNNKFRYTLHNDKGEVLFTKEFPLPVMDNALRFDYRSIAMKDNGDLVFIVSDKQKDDASDSYVYVIEAATQKMLTKKLDVPGKRVDNYPNIFIASNGEIVLSYKYGLFGKLYDSYSGIAFDRFSPTLELIQHKEIPFSGEILSKYGDTKQPGTLKDFTTVVSPTTSGYAVLLYESVRKQTGPKQWDYQHNHVMCIGVNNKFDVAFTKNVYEVDNSSNWCIYRPVYMYTSGDNIYILHGGKDDKVKNTKEEFEIYCSYWKAGDADIKTAKVNRSSNELELYFTNKKLDDNSYIFSADANAYFTFKIKEK